MGTMGSIAHSRNLTDFPSLIQSAHAAHGARVRARVRHVASTASDWQYKATQVGDATRATRARFNCLLTTEGRG